jgi:hypothetical protein
MPYSDAVIKEAFRMHPAVGQLLEHVPKKVLGLMAIYLQRKAILPL